MSTTNEPTDFSQYSLEDIEQAKNQQSSTPREERTCCPECRSIAIRRTNVGVSNRVDYRYRCRKCGARFEQPDDADPWHPNAERFPDMRHLAGYVDLPPEEHPTPAIVPLGLGDLDADRFEQPEER